MLPRTGLTHVDHRFMASGWGESPKGDRWCTFVPGAKVVLTTAEVHFPIRIPSDRQTFCATTPVSSRSILFSYTAVSEQIIDFVVVQKTLVFTPVTHSTIIHAGDQLCYVETLDRISPRTIMYSLLVASEVTTLVQRMQLVHVHTPSVNFGVLGLTTERWCEVVKGHTHTDRHCFMMGNPHSDRHITFNILMASERFVSIVVHRMKYIHEFKMIQATPYPTERHCWYVPIIYNTERLSFLESRPVFVTKTPNAVKTDMILYSDHDEKVQLSITNERNTEVNSDSIDKLEKENTITTNKVTFSATKNNFEVTSVDNMGASVAKNNANKERKIVSANVCCLNIKFNDT